VENERRRAPRHMFIAAAEVMDESVGSRLPSRVSDLSADGCYLDTINPFCEGTAVRVKITNAAQHFEAPATVVYSVLHMGMGLRFREVAPEQEAVLRNWLPQG
jgi:PilZ domain-containing protein